MALRCLCTHEFVHQLFSVAGFSDENSKWLTPAQKKQKIEQSEEDEDSDSQWEEEDDDKEEGFDNKKMKEEDDDEDMVDDYGADEGDDQDSDGEEVWFQPMRNICKEEIVSFLKCQIIYVDVYWCRTT